MGIMGDDIMAALAKMGRKERTFVSGVSLPPPLLLCTVVNKRIPEDLTGAFLFTCTTGWGYRIHHRKRGKTSKSQALTARQAA